jgi:DNA gyrase subunit A
MVVNERNGMMVGATQVFGGEDIMLISNQGTLVRTRVDEVSLLSRNTQGVTLIKLADDEHLVGVERIPELEGEDDDLDELDAEQAEGSAESSEESSAADDNDADDKVDE